MNVHALRNHMGELLGPKPTVEIVITHFLDGTVNFQFVGMGAPSTPEQILRLLELVASDVAKHIPAQEAQV